MPRNHQAVAGILAGFSESNKALEASASLELVSNVKLGRDSYKLVFSHLNTVDYSSKAYINAIQNMFDNRLRVIAETAELEDEGMSRNLSVVVVANTESRAFTNESIAESNLKLVTANVFLNPTDNSIWDVKTVAGVQRIVRQNNDDLDDIVAARQAKARMTTIASLASDFDTGQGDFVAFFDTKAQDVKTGVAFRTEAGLYVWGRETKGFRKVADACVLAGFGAAELKSKGIDTTGRSVMAAEINSDNLGRFKDYMLRLYKGTPFMTKLESLFGDRLGFKAGDQSTTASLEDTLVVSAAVLKSGLKAVKAGKATPEQVLSYIVKAADEDFDADDFDDAEDSDAEGDADGDGDMPWENDEDDAEESSARGADKKSRR